MRMSRLCVLLSVLVFVLAIAIPTWTQITTATLQGQILDPSGGSIPKAKVTAVNKATGVTRTVETTSSGEYDLTAIPVGDYTVTAESTGFQTQAKDVTLQVGQTATLDFSLAVGEATEKVIV
ncbi:MAG TPA: carboxypeptidase-like regulatory domain-containing protein [Candidatus Acidoferrales bacterium]|nr:carboxypeptidase-like regulatory domain-containing protein [Candidatus Acidoferrales bacterium]